MAATAKAPEMTAETAVSVLTTLSAGQLCAVLAGDPVRAAPWVRAAALCGLPQGQVRYGRMLLEGRGVARDRVAALAWFSRAAEARDAEAQNMAGRCHENGWGTPVDIALAARWYGRAAEAGHAWARYNLGHLYLNGHGVARDPAEAFVWYRRAADQGHVHAMNLVARCREQGWGTQADPAAARDAYRRAAEGGYFRGQFNFASLLAAEGRIDEALAWFERACDGAPVDSRRTMAEALTASDHPDLRALGRRVLPDGAPRC